MGLTTPKNRVKMLLVILGPETNHQLGNRRLCSRSVGKDDMTSIVDLIWRIIADTAFQALYVAGLLTACAVVLHQLDRIISGMLSQAFGWKSVLWTGWIGTPIHELSHAALCLVFFHRIDEMVLYNPDPKTGVLGYVRHSYNPKNPWAKIGCAFIGIAPLFGGALALSLAMYLLVPSNPLSGLTDLGKAAFASAEGLADQAVAALRMSTTVFTETLTADNLTRWQFWVFLYLVLCIGTHVSPSRADLAGSYAGFGAILALLLLLNALAQIWGGIGSEMVAVTARYITPIVALLMMAVVLNLVALAGVFLVVTAFRGLRGESFGALSRTLSPHWTRLGIVGVITLVFLVAAAGAGRAERGAGFPDAVADAVFKNTRFWNLCGHSSARPKNVSGEAWSKYECRDKNEAGAQWKKCRRQRAYAKKQGSGCPSGERCCPPSK